MATTPEDTMTTQTAAHEFQVTTQTMHTFREGWGVDFMPVWDDDDRIVDVDSSVVRITPDVVEVRSGMPLVKIAANAYVPVANFRELDDLTYDDQHDLRARWFFTEDEARAHETSVMEQWRNPLPWQSFVTLD